MKELPMSVVGNFRAFIFTLQEAPETSDGKKREQIARSLRFGAEKQLLLIGAKKVAMRECCRQNYWLHPHNKLREAYNSHHCSPSTKSTIHTVQVILKMKVRRGAVATVSVLLSSSARPTSFALGADVVARGNVSRHAEPAKNVSFAPCFRCSRQVRLSSD